MPGRGSFWNTKGGALIGKAAAELLHMVATRLVAERDAREGARQAADNLRRAEGEDDPYAVLQVSPDADFEVVTAAYRARMRKFHPDKNPDGAEEAKRINDAYRRIKERRQAT